MLTLGREPSSSGYGKRLTFWRSWVQIPVPYTGWTFFTYICCQNCNVVCLKRPKINKKEAGIGPFLKKNLCWHQFVRENAIIKTHLGTENRTYWQLSKCLYAFIKVQNKDFTVLGAGALILTYGKPSTTYKWERGRG